MKFNLLAALAVTVSQAAKLQSQFEYDIDGNLKLTFIAADLESFAKTFGLNNEGLLVWDESGDADRSDVYKYLNRLLLEKTYNQESVEYFDFKMRENVDTLRVETELIIPIIIENVTEGTTVTDV